MSDEYFYGCTLSASNKTETWDPEAQAEFSRSSHKLTIRQALLGADAKPGELNVVQVGTMCVQEAVTIPVAVLRVGEQRHARLDIEFPDAPVDFTLTQGSGPVHLIGLQILGALVGGSEDDPGIEDMEEEMLNEEEKDDESKGKKSKMSNNDNEASPKKNVKK